MTENEIDEIGQRFLVELCERTEADTTAQVAMHNIGASLGLDKDASAHAAEELMGLQLVEIRTLSGGIGITPEGVEEAHRLGARTASAEESQPRLGDAPIIDGVGCEAVQEIAAHLKSQVGELGLAFDDLTEMVADLKTIDAQMVSSRPKTAIIRESLRSIRGVLEKAGAVDRIVPIKNLLGE